MDARRTEPEDARLAAGQENDSRESARQDEEAPSILQTIMENVPEGITLTGGPPDFPIIANSKHATQLLGRDPKALLNIPAGTHAAAYGILLPDGTRPKPEQMPLYRACHHGEVIPDEELIIERPDGSRIIILSNVTPIRDSQGRVIGAINCWRDITERKRAEDKLRRSGAYLSQSQRLSRTGSWAWNVATGELYWSEGHFRILGIEPGGITASYEFFFTLIHPDDRSMLREAFDHAITKRAAFEREFRIFRPDGTIRDIHSVAQPIFNEAGELSEYVGSIMDITERKLAEEELQKTHAELAHVSRVTTIGELAASIAHEINQPLGAIANNASACSRLLSAAPPEARDALREIIQDVNRASAIIARVRSLTKGSGPERASLDVKDIITDVLALAQRQLGEREIAVRTDFGEDLPLVLADRVELQQVFLNLIVNAIEAMEGLGSHRRSLIVSARRHEVEKSPAVLVSIRDCGIGFAPKTEEHLFEPFFTTKAGGLGMGLRISRSIVEAHGGRLWAKRNDDQGATFFCALPAAVLDPNSV